MRGQRLFVRPIEGSDRPEVVEFLKTYTDTAEAPAWGLLGKLVGRLVAVVAMEITSDAVRIDDIVVAGDLRRKWIGRAMLREAAELARKIDKPQLLVTDARGADEFLRRVGFEQDGAQWTRRVG
ncbi:MAG TPA: GNAT family N-acetyltransferase [Thermoanaerobaculia bacterium]